MRKQSVVATPKQKSARGVKKVPAKKPTKIEIPVKKKGRPSKADLESRKLLKLAAERVIKDLIRQTSAEVPAIAPDGTPMVKPDYPVFKDGERVESIPSVVVGPSVPKGYVSRQDIGSPLVFVRWDGGISDWRFSKTLQLCPTKRRATKKQK